MAKLFLYVIPILAVGLLVGLFYVMPLFNRIFKKYDAMNESIQENVAGIRVVKTFVREEYEQNKFEKISGEVCKDFTFAEKIMAATGPLMMFCMYLSMLLVDYFGARLIISTRGSEFTTGELSSLIAYGVQILTSMMMLSFIVVMCSMAEESAKRIKEVLNHESSIVSPSNGVKEVKNGDIEFNNVSFKYKRLSENYAL